MRSVITPWMSLPLAVISAAFAGPAPAADHDTPLSATKNIYPSGADINQNFSQPDPAAASLADPAATAGHVSGAAAMSHMLSQPRAMALASKQMTHTLKSQTRIRLTHVDAQMVNGDTPAPSLYKFTYGFHYKGVPLWKYSSQSQIIQANGNRRKVLLVRERNMPRPDQFGDTEATVKPEDATRKGLDDSKEATKSPLDVDQAFEVPHREIHVDADGKGTLAWAFVVRSTDRARPFARRYWVAARDEARVLSREDLIYHDAPAALQQGKVTGTYFGIRKSPFDDPSQDEGLNDFTIVPGSSPIVTDANGFFSLSRQATLGHSLAGPFCRIINEAGRPLVPARDGISLSFNASSPEQLAQVTAFKWVSTAHAFVKDFLPTNADRLVGLPTHVNIDDTCNAFFDPGEHTLNFFKAGDGCVNTAYCDVACHEFGHAVDDQFGDILDGGYSEGFGDALAMLITRDSVIGRDFQGKGKNLRNGQDVVTWPPRDPEVHAVGRIYGGFAWELIQQLKAKLGDEDKAFEAARNLILGAAALNPKDTPDAVRLSFLVDSQNGSPFFQQISNAAESRHLPRPDSPEAVQSPSFMAAGSR